jgi:cell division protease FtsH
MLREAEQRAVAVLKEHRQALDRLVDLLLANETVDGSQVYALAGRPEPEVAAGGMTMAPRTVPSRSRGGRSRGTRSPERR